MNNRFLQSLAGSIVSVFLLGSCASGTKLVAQWKDDEYRGHPSKIFVVGFSPEYGPRTLVEDEFVRQLKARGNDAVASYTVLPGEAMPDKDTALAKVQELGADTVIVVRFLKKEAGDTHTPLRRYGVPAGFDTSWDGYMGYYGTSTDVGVRDVSYDYDVISMETTLFQAATRKPIWSTLSQTTYQGGPIKQIKPFTKAIIQNLVQQGVVR